MRQETQKSQKKCLTSNRVSTRAAKCVEVKWHSPLTEFFRIILETAVERIRAQRFTMAYVRTALPLLFIKSQVLCFEQFAVEHALFNKKLRPLKIAVTVKQGVVQIK